MRKETRSSAASRALMSVSSLALLGAFTAPAFAQIETVIVTAERRVQNLQTVPVAVTAFTAETRDKIGIQTIQDMANFTPGMSYSTSTDRVTMRGVSRQTNVLSADSGVANYSDGIYQSFAVEAGRSTLDLDRVEILRGPQGTLYGRNSIGGAINQITPRPTDTFEAQFRADYGSYDHSVIEGSISGPITDDWQFRLYGDWERQGKGWVKNSLGPDEGNVIDTWYVEGQLQAKFGQDLDMWSRVYSTAWNNGAGGAGAASGGWTPADFPTYEVGQGDLVPNAGYGCTVFAAQPLTPVSNPTYPNAGGDTTVSAATSPLANPCQNPSVQNPWHIARITPYTVTVPAAYFGTSQWVYHTGMDFDVKYIFGAEWYRYVLTGPNQFSPPGTGQYQAPISSFTIGTDLPQTIPLGPGGVCFDAILNPSGACPPVTIHPQAAFNYQQQEFFTQNELNFVSTGDNPLQWQGGLYWFQQHESQPVSAALPGEPAVSFPINAVPEGPFTLPHDPIGNRWYDDRVRFNDTSLAVYGQVDYKVTPDVKLSVGARYSNDHKYGYEASRLVDFPIAPEFFGAFTFAFDVTPPGSLAPGADVVDYFSGNSGPCSQAGAPVAPTPDIGVPRCGQYNAATGFAERRYNHSSDAFTGSVGVEYTPDEDTLAYAKYSRGYKGGGFNTGIFSFINPKPWVAAEHVNAFEVGLKKTFGDMLVLDVATFYYDYSGMQFPLSIAASPGGVNTIEFLSIPHARSYGVEAEVVATPFEPLNLLGSFPFNDAHVPSSPVPGLGGRQGIVDGADPNGVVPGAKPLFTPAECAATQFTVQDCAVDIFTFGTARNPSCPALPAPCGLPTLGWAIPQSLKGQRLPNAPRVKIALAASYDWLIPELGTLTPEISYRWIGKQYGAIFSRFYNAAPSWDQWDARVSFASPDGHWTVLAYGKNLFQQIGYDTGSTGSRYAGTIDRNCDGTPSFGGFGQCNFVQGQTTGVATPTPPGYGAVRGESAFGTVTNYSVTPPRTFGMQLQFRF